MKRLMGVVIIVFLVTGCASVRDEGCGVGAGLGAILGGALGKELGGDIQSTMLGVFIGVGLGGAAGCSYADKIAKRNEELAGKEDDLNAQINFAKGVNQDTEEYNQNIEQKIVELKPKIDKLVAQIDRKNITNEKLKEEQQNLDSWVKATGEQLALAQTELDRLRSFPKKQNSDELDQQIADLEANVTILEGNTRALASQRQRI